MHIPPYARRTCVHRALGGRVQLPTDFPWSGEFRGENPSNLLRNGRRDGQPADRRTLRSLQRQCVRDHRFVGLAWQCVVLHPISDGRHGTPNRFRKVLERFVQAEVLFDILSIIQGDVCVHFVDVFDSDEAGIKNETPEQRMHRCIH